MLCDWAHVVFIRLHWKNMHISLLKDVQKLPSGLSKAVSYVLFIAQQVVKSIIGLCWKQGNLLVHIPRLFREN